MRNPPALTDTDLVELTRSGDRQAFEVLMRRHAGRVHALALRMMRNPVDAQDIAQETFFNAYRRIDGFRGDSAFSSWLYRIATNSCLMKMRSRRRRPEVSLDVIVGADGEDGWERPVVDRSPHIDKEYENRELGLVIQEAMQNLPGHYRAVFVLADLEHKSMKEVADELDLTVPNVKTRLHRARLKLRERLSEYLAAQPVASAA